MGKVRKVVMGDEKVEKEQRKKAEVRRETKKFKKEKVEGVGLHGGERTSVVSGTELKGDIQSIIDQVEGGTGDAKGKADKVKRKKGPKKHSKKYQHARSIVDKTKQYPLKEAVGLVKKTSYTKFDGTVELHVNLNPAVMDGKKDLRGEVTLPHGTGKQVRVVEASDAIVAEVEKGIINFDILVSRPAMMPKLAKVARILGPKGLMPNPKTGTVTEDVDKRIKELSQGQVQFKTEPENPLIHMVVGKVSFEEKQIMENIESVIKAVGKGKIAKLTISATMGPGIKIQI